jgi:8-oxo-dGTP diphosphatase
MSMSEKTVEVAIAIIYQNDHFLMQLRDNIPTIKYPGYWGLFGGHIEEGETPEIALKRELIEEINYHTDNISFFGIYPDPYVIRHVFATSLDTEISTLNLQEGWDLALISPAQIQAGEAFSSKAGMRPLGSRHREILLDFIARN